MTVKGERAECIALPEDGGMLLVMYTDTLERVWVEKDRKAVYVPEVDVFVWVEEDWWLDKFK